MSLFAFLFLTGLSLISCQSNVCQCTCSNGNYVGFAGECQGGRNCNIQCSSKYNEMCSTYNGICMPLPRSTNLALFPLILCIASPIIFLIVFLSLASKIGKEAPESFQENKGKRTLLILFILFMLVSSILFWYNTGVQVNSFFRSFAFALTGSLKKTQVLYSQKSSDGNRFMGRVD